MSEARVFPPPGRSDVRPSSRGGWRLAAVLLGVFGLVAAIWLVRVTGAPDFADNDQMKPVGYTLDVVRHGSWSVQRDLGGSVASKPPLAVWVSAAASLMMGEVNRVALTLPGFIGVGGLAVLAAWVGERRFGRHVGLFAGLGVVCSVTGEKLVALVRTDGLFALTVSAAGYAAFLAWEHGRRDRFGGWAWFWTLGAVATLTKGPLGLVLAAMGMLGAVWERWGGRSRLAAAAPAEGRDGDASVDVGSGGRRRRRWRAAVEHAVGVVAFLIIVGGWFWFAYRAEGEALIDKMIGDELVDHATYGDESDPSFFASVFKSPAYFLTYYAPVSVFAAIGVVRTVLRPAPHGPTRRLERFLWCWLVGGLVLFSLSPHQRPDLLSPLWLPMAVLGGREFARLFEGASGRAVGVAAAVAAVGVIGAAAANRHMLVPREDETASERMLAAAAKRWSATPISDDAIVHTSDPQLFRYHLGVHRENVTPERAATLASSGEVRFVAVGRRESDVAAALREAGVAWETAFEVAAPDERLRLEIWDVGVGRQGEE